MRRRLVVLALVAACTPQRERPTVTLPPEVDAAPHAEEPRRPPVTDAAAPVVDAPPEPPDQRAPDGPAATADAGTDASTDRPAGAGDTSADRPLDVGAALDVGGAPVPCAFALCESFESVPAGGAPDPAVWRKSGDVKVESGQAARGKQALHVKTSTGVSFPYIHTSKPFPFAGNAFHGRLFLRIDRVPGALPAKLAHWNLVEAKGTGNRNAIRYGGLTFTPTDHRWIFNIQTASVEDAQGEKSNSRIPERTWMCVEWLFDGARNEARFWWDGVERPVLHYRNGFSGADYRFPTFDTLSIGWALYQAVDRGYDVWIDEVAVDAQRIGCDR